eukprot:8369714-Prorocentrum_lima.AAC.1
MTSSLVGSEMCIRDSPWFVRLAPPFQEVLCPSGCVMAYMPGRLSPDTVSYTHLTLPTICSV